MPYFILKNNKTHGPFTKSQIENGLNNGKLTGEELFSDEPTGPWQKVDQLSRDSFPDHVETEPETSDSVSPPAIDAGSDFITKFKQIPIRPLAIGSLATGILSITLGFCCGIFLLFAFPAVVLGGWVIYYVKTEESGWEKLDFGLAVAGIVVGVFAFFGFGIIVLVLVATAP